MIENQINQKKYGIKNILLNNSYKRNWRRAQATSFSGWGEKITVSANGSVVKSIRDNGESAWQETLMATIAPHDISNLITTVLDLMAGELIFPEVEGCTCVPVTSYAARNQLENSWSSAADQLIV